MQSSIFFILLLLSFFGHLQRLLAKSAFPNSRFL